MATQRYISTSFWDDAWIQTLDPSEKLLYLYFMSNPLTNIAGVYKITRRRISFDTGFNDDTIGHILGKFEKAKKAYLVGEYIILPSWPHHQKWQIAPKIKLGIDSILSGLPPGMLGKLKELGYQYPIDTLSIEHTYPSSYSDSDLDSDIDIDSDKDIDSGFVSVIDESPKPDGGNRIARAIDTWNRLDLVPQYRLNSLTMFPQEREDCRRIMTGYTDAQIAEAMQTYKEIRASPEHEVPIYQSMPGFMKGGVAKFEASAKPWEQFKKRSKGFETADERDERRRKEIAVQLGVPYDG